MQLNTIPPNDFSFYEELNAAVQAEPAGAFDPEMAGLFAAIGIQKGKPFEPSEKTKEILSDAIAVGNATARALLFAPRNPQAILYEDRQWRNAFIGGSYEFLEAGARLLDARTAFHYYATGITPSMAEAKPGTGSAYAYAVRDAKGDYLDGGKTYRITLPAPVPAEAFWSFVVYDSQTRSLLETTSGRPGSTASTRRSRPTRTGPIRSGSPAGAGGPGRQLGADQARQELERHLQALRTPGAVVRQNLEARRFRAGGLTRPVDNQPMPAGRRKAPTCADPGCCLG